MSAYVNMGRFGGASQWGEEDHIVFSGHVAGSSNRVGYGTFSLSTGWTLHHNFAWPETVSTVVTDGKFVFCSNSGGYVRQYRWSGSALVQVLDAKAGAGGNTCEGLAIIPGTNKMFRIGQEAFQSGISLTAYQTAPTYSYAENDSVSGSTLAWRRGLGARVANPNTNAVPDTIVVVGDGAKIMRSYTVSGTSLVQHGSITAPSGPAHAKWRMDPDTGLIVGANFTPTNTTPIVQLNMSTRALSTTGTSNTMASNARAITAIKGMVVALGVDRTLRSYSLSGTTLTLLDSVANAAASDSSYNYLWASPYTGLIYLIHTSTTNCRVYSLATDGTLSQEATNITFRDPATGVESSMGFSPAALEVSAS